jgi:hypothetical protein
MCQLDCKTCKLPACDDPDEFAENFYAQLDGLYLDENEDYAEDEAAYSERCFAEEVQFLMDIGNLECSEVGC